MEKSGDICRKTSQYYLKAAQTLIVEITLDLHGYWLEAVVQGRLNSKVPQRLMMFFTEYHGAFAVYSPNWAAIDYAILHVHIDMPMLAALLGEPYETFNTPKLGSLCRDEHLDSKRGRRTRPHYRIAD